MLEPTMPRPHKPARKPARTPQGGPAKPDRRSTPPVDPKARKGSARPGPRGQRGPGGEETLVEADSARKVFLPGGIGIVHEDADLVVVDKPAGILTAGMPGEDVPSVFRAIKAHVRDQVRRRGTQVWIVHRLDKEASGLLVFAKTEKAFTWLKEEFRTKRAHRLYSAVVEGEIGPPDEGTIQNYLVEDERGIVREAPGAVGPGGAAKLAVTHWRVQRVGHGRTLLTVRLETGRKNQIRVHLAGLGHPIVGDRRYGATTDPIGHVCLHAFELGFTDPGTGQSLRFRSPTPGSYFGLVGAGEGKSRSEREGDRAGPTESPGVAPPRTPDMSGAKVRVREMLASTGAAPGDSQSLISGVGMSNAPGVGAGEELTASPSQSTGSWDHVAEWYDELIEDRGSDHHQRVIAPGTLRLLGELRGRRVLDVACGQGGMCRVMAGLGASVVGVDASGRLIEAAKRGDAKGTYLVGDARNLPEGTGEGFDAATCIMALMNIDPLSPVLAGMAGRLRPGGVAVAVLLHPAFRSPGQTSWQWDNGGGDERRDARGRRDGRPPRDAREDRPASRDVRQYRRVDGYLSQGHKAIVMNPAAAAQGKPAVTTVTYHRPIQAYVQAFAQAGLLVSALEEWPSLRLSQPGPRAAEENRARREIPMFLAIRGVKAGQ
ncbi:MAG: methyltransferase domain-containing protein [Tepidisphaera sp.]|nr:methyltransferase domain-containing protein [Tepidisphaera sp.]